MTGTFDERKKLVADLEEQLNQLNQKLDMAELKAHLAKADAEDRAKKLRDDIAKKAENLGKELKSASDELMEKAEVKIKLNWKQFQSDMRETFRDIEAKYEDLKKIVRE